MFETLPADSRLWVFGLEKPGSNESEQHLLSRLRSFVSSWKAHGNPVRAEAEIVQHTFVVIAADPNVSEVSGCSIDAMFRSVSEFAEEVQLQIADFDRIFFRTENEIACVTRPEFKRLAAEGRVGADTAVFDTTVETLASFRVGWEKPLDESWHKRLLPQI